MATATTPEVHAVLALVRRVSALQALPQTEFRERVDRPQVKTLRRLDSHETIVVATGT